MADPIIHLVLHFVVPAVLARVVFPEEWKKAWLIMVLTMAVDTDHLLADPIFDPNRCSIGFHPLHTAPAIGLDLVMAALPRTRIAGTGLVIHMALDWIYCLRLAF